jgi:hypothetical protein
MLVNTNICVGIFFHSRRPPTYKCWISSWQVFQFLFYVSLSVNVISQNQEVPRYSRRYRLANVIHWIQIVLCAHLTLVLVIHYKYRSSTYVHHHIEKQSHAIVATKWNVSLQKIRF